MTAHHRQDLINARMVLLKAWWHLMGKHLRGTISTDTYMLSSTVLQNSLKLVAADLNLDEIVRFENGLSTNSGIDQQRLSF